MMGQWPVLCAVACLASSSPVAHNSSRNRSLRTSLFLSPPCSLSLARPPSLVFSELGENEEGPGLQLAANELGVQTSSHKYELLRQPIWNFGNFLAPTWGVIVMCYDSLCVWESSEELAEVAGGDDSSDDQPSTSDHKNSELQYRGWEEHHRSPIRYWKRLINWVR